MRRLWSSYRAQRALSLVQTPFSSTGAACTAVQTRALCATRVPRSAQYCYPAVTTSSTHSILTSGTNRTTRGRRAQFAGRAERVDVQQPRVLFPARRHADGGSQVAKTGPRHRAPGEPAGMCRVWYQGIQCPVSGYAVSSIGICNIWYRDMQCLVPSGTEIEGPRSRQCPVLTEGLRLLLCCYRSLCDVRY